jgi:hypothetical protein
MEGPISLTGEMEQQGMKVSLAGSGKSKNTFECLKVE